MNNRSQGRTHHEARPVSFQIDPFGYADAAVLICCGNTKVLASVSMTSGVPFFMKNQGIGWLTAEYAMLPSSTQTRSQRESSQSQKNSRSVEISRLVGRSLRAAVDLSGIGERTITIDCDVLQADGGTRVAAITAASLALRIAEKRYLEQGILQKPFVTDAIAAISVAVVEGEVLVDVDQKEDNNADADFNLVLSASGKIVEIQGTAEKAPLDWDAFDAIKTFAIKSVSELLLLADEALATAPNKILLVPQSRNQENKNNNRQEKKSAMFALGNRLKE
jgi:ribonuclease PH